MTSIGKKSIYGFLLIVTLLPTVLYASPGDSTVRASWTISPRLHSAGYFPFTGSLLNHNPVADYNIFYSGKTFGFFIFQSFDLKDTHSYANYLQPGVFATWYANPNLRVRAFFGYIFSQTECFRDPDSDYFSSLQLNWKVSPHFRIENTLLFYDFSVNKKLANRVLLEWSSQKIKVGTYIWQRTVLDESFNSTSASLAVTFPMITLSKRVNIELTSQYIGYLTKTKPDYALQKGLIFTLAVPMTFGK